MTKQVKKGPAFLLKTYDMIEEEKFKQTIAWNQQGIGFFVYDSQKLATDILPIYFKHSNIHSFIRQLNMYGFNKTRGKKSDNYYFHPLFKRGQKNLIYQIQRKVQKKGSKKQTIALKSQSNQNLSIEIQQENQSQNCQIRKQERDEIQQNNKQNTCSANQNNKQNNSSVNNKNKSWIDSSLKITQSRASQSNVVLQCQLKKKIVTLLNINKYLILQQYCNLNQISQIYSSNQNSENSENSLQQKKNQNLLIFKANEYIKCNLSIWESIKHAYEKKFQQIEELKERQNNTNSKKNIIKTSQTISNKNNNVISEEQIKQRTEESQSKQNQDQSQSQSQSKKSKHNQYAQSSFQNKKLKKLSNQQQKQLSIQQQSFQICCSIQDKENISNHLND